MQCAQNYIHENSFLIRVSEFLCHIINCVQHKKGKQRLITITVIPLVIKQTYVNALILVASLKQYEHQHNRIQVL